MSMSFIGSYSGIDQNTIDQLMQAERMPLKQLTNRQLDITEKKDAWKDVNTRLNSLFERMNDLKSTSSFNTKIATSSNEQYVTIDAGNSAAEGKYDIKIEQLATSASIIGSKVEDVTTSEGKPAELGKEGYFTIKNSDNISVKIEMKESDTLRDVVNKINSMTKDSRDAEGKIIKDSGSGISATIVDNRIVFSDEKTGERSITLGGDGQGTLTRLSLNGAARKETAGENAIFTLNGITIERSTNRISDAIEGIAINLNKAHEPGQTDSVNISSDTEKAAKAMEDFVDQYNSTMKFIEEKTAGGDPKVVGSKGSLAGESSLIRLQSTLRRMVTDVVGEKSNSIRGASQIGVSTFDRFGALKFDKERFLTELGKDKDAVMNFLNPKVGEGFVERFNKEVNGFISKSDGVIKDKNDSYDKSLKELATRIENFEARMVKKEAYYVKTFTALDLAMMKAEDQMGWLQGQVDSMNGGRR